MKHIYPSNLEKEIIRSKYIPRKFRSNEHMKLYHKYWMPSFGGVTKVDDILFIDGVEYYFFKIYGKMTACTTYPIDHDEIYEMLHNYNSIEDQCIINSKKSYSGAEIKYWFTYNKIDFNDPEYRGFWPFLNPSSMNVVADNKYYTVIHDNTKNQKFQMILDRTKSY